MSLQTKYYPTLTTNHSIVQKVLTVLIANLALVLASQVAIHLWWPVPITLQSAMVILLGLTLGSQRAAIVVALYLFEGAIGLPVLAGGLGGFAYLVGPSAGFLWGFLPAAFLAGFLMEKWAANNFILIFGAALLSTAVVFAIGFAHLCAFFSPHQAYLYGVQPFLLIEPIKLSGVSIAARLCWKKM